MHFLYIFLFVWIKEHDSYLININLFHHVIWLCYGHLNHQINSFRLVFLDELYENKSEQQYECEINKNMQKKTNIKV